jgi:NitT/TauT family transport system permease protein
MLEQVEQFLRREVRRETQPTQTAIYRPARHYRWLPPVIALVSLGLWYFLTRDQSGAAFLVASPDAVARQFVTTLLNGSLLRHIGTTLLEIALGFVLGVGCAFVLGYGIARNTLLEQVVSPYAVGFQAVPIVAIAPVLIRFFGPGIVSNGIICALIVFFPMLVSTIVGIRNVDPDLRDLMRSLSATRWQTFVRLEIPAALPVLFGGLKISTTLAVVGAVVGEAISADAGLGFLIYSARYVYDTSLVLVGVFTLTALALGLYGLVSRVERHALAWQRRGRS